MPYTISCACGFAAGLGCQLFPEKACSCCRAVLLLLVVGTACDGKGEGPVDITCSHKAPEGETASATTVLVALRFYYIFGRLVARSGWTAHALSNHQAVTKAKQCVPVLLMIAKEGLLQLHSMLTLRLTLGNS